MPIAKFYFYTVKTNKRNFLDLMNELYDKHPGKDGSCLIGGKPCRLSREKPKDFGGSCAALLTKIRMTELPNKRKTDGTSSELNLDEDEGLGEDAAIAYNTETNVIAIQRNVYSLTDNNIAQLFNSFFPDEQVQFKPILSTEAIKRLISLNTIRKFRVKLSQTNDLSFIKESNVLSTEDKILIQSMMQEPNVDFICSMGYNKGGLGDRIKRLIDFFLKFSRTNTGADAVKVLQITGKHEDTNTTMLLDLLSERLTFEHEVQLAGRTIDKNHLMRVACASIAQNIEELRAYKNV